MSSDLSRLEKTAGGFALARRDSRRFAAFQVEDVLLEKGVSRFAFALEDQLLAVGREIAFAAPFAFEDQLARVRDEAVLLGSVISR